MSYLDRFLDVIRSVHIQKLTGRAGLNHRHLWIFTVQDNEYGFVDNLQKENKKKQTLRQERHQTYSTFDRNTTSTFRSWMMPRSRCHSTISTAIGSRKKSTLDPIFQLTRSVLLALYSSDTYGASWMNWKRLSLLIVRSRGWIPTVRNNG